MDGLKIYEARAIYPSQRLNTETLHDNANAFLPAVKQIPPIHAASISLFPNYRHPTQVIYEVITVSTCISFQCQCNCIAVPTSPNDQQYHNALLCSFDTYVRTMNYTERGSDL
jgi:hypothetical protein